MNETYQHANELLDMIAEGDRNHVFRLLSDQYPDRYRPLSEKRMTKALKFLAETPSKRSRRWDKLAQDAQIRLWTDSRFLALQAANALALSETVAPYLGGAHRQATKNIAKAVHDLRLQPTAQEIAHQRK